MQFAATGHVDQTKRVNETVITTCDIPFAIVTSSTRQTFDLLFYPLNVHGFRRFYYGNENKHFQSASIHLRDYSYCLDKINVGLSGQYVDFHNCKERSPIPPCEMTAVIGHIHEISSILHAFTLSAGQLK